MYRNRSREKCSQNVVAFYQGSCFSNFFLSSFIIDEITFSCVEQYLMFCKAKMFQDHHISRLILHQKSPLLMKKLGRLISNFDEKIWKMKREKIAFDGLYAKFSQNSNLRDKLLSTGVKILAEASATDRIWGTGIGLNNRLALHPKYWCGQNLLGKTLMKVRTSLQNPNNLVENHGL